MENQNLINILKDRPHWIRWIDDDNGYICYQCSHCGAREMGHFPSDTCFNCGNHMAERIDTTGLIEQGTVRTLIPPHAREDTGRYEWRAEDGTRMFQAVLVRVGRDPRIVHIGNYGYNLEAIIGAEEICAGKPYLNGAVFLYDDGAEERGERANRVIRDPDTGEEIGVIYGDFLIVGRECTDEEYESFLRWYDLDDYDEPMHFHGLPDDLCDLFVEMFKLRGE